MNRIAVEEVRFVVYLEYGILRVRQNLLSENDFS